MSEYESLASVTHPRSTKQRFIIGVIVFVPVVVTIRAVWWLFGVVDGVLGKTIQPLLPFSIPGSGVLLLFLSILITGYLATTSAGTAVIKWIEEVFTKTPVASWIYGTVTQITHSTVVGQAKTFRECVLVQYPRTGLWVVGFVTAQSPPVFLEATGQEELAAVFIPTTPNPTSGFLIYAPRSELVPAGVPVETGFQLVVTGGAVYSNREDPQVPKKTLSEIIAGL